jgi:hypothetical protein
MRFFGSGWVASYLLTAALHGPDVKIKGSYHNWELGT